MSQTKRCTVKAYLKDVVRPYRHEEPGSAMLSTKEVLVDGLSKMEI